MKKLLLVPALMVSFLNASTYDDNYSVLKSKGDIVKNNNMFMFGDFEQIIRYDEIVVDGESENKIFNQIVEKIKELKDANLTTKVNIIGYTNRRTDDASELSIDSDSYANAIQNWFRSDLDTNSSIEKSKNYAVDVQNALIDNGVDKNDTYVEYRAGIDELYVETDGDAKDLNNRVMVTLYVDKAPIKQEQKRELDSDKDGVFDKNDECPNTPQNVTVNENGCPLDSDNDGVYDYQDKCPNTISGLKVDVNGCALKSTLKLNFKTSSAKILTDSYPTVQKFAHFLKENPSYKVTITGHTDSVGKAVSNLKLSQKRAQSVKEALVVEGVEASRILAVGKGELEPIASNRTREGRRENRRIEVELHN